MNKQISLEKRYQIAACLEADFSKKDIAQKIGFSKRTVYKEIERNSKRVGKKNVYDPKFAHKLCLKRHQLKEKKINLTEPVKRRIRWLIKCLWSPEQIALTCKQKAIEMVSIETIYEYLYRLKTKGIDLCKHLRRNHKKRRKRSNSKHSRQIIKDKVNIKHRPKEANEASEIGHMEIDLMKCMNGYLLTITDRKSLYNIIRKIPNKSSETILQTLLKIKKIYAWIMKTITSDNGTEFAKHKQGAMALNILWFFADPYCSQQRGCNENQNGLIRQFASRKTDLNKISEEQILTWQKMLNYRPRKKLNFKKPIEIFRTQNVNFIS